MAMFDTDELIKTGTVRLRQVLSILLGLVTVVGIYFIVLGAFKVPLEDRSLMWSLLSGLGIVTAWWSAQTDNRLAISTGDKTLIVTSWTRDLLIVIVSALAAAVVLGVFQIVVASVVIAGAAGGLSGWLVFRHFWLRANG